MKKVLILFCALICFSVQAQNDQKDINEQVWKPFTKAIMTQDVEGFVKVHSKDLIRAERNSKRVLNFEEYQKRMLESWPQWKENNAKNNLQYQFELRFTERNSNGTVAYEVGYFRNLTTKPNGETRTGFGKFQVALRRENGVWKILVDSDSNEGGTITEKDFLGAKPMEE